MNKNQAEALFAALGSKASSSSDEWVRGACPFAPWLHKSGKDSKPSFGLWVAQGQQGRFHCFTCETGSLSYLLQTIEFLSQKQPGKFKGDIAKAREIVENEEVDLPVLDEYSEFATDSKKQFEPLPDYFLDSFVPLVMSQRACMYLGYRGFTVEEGKALNLRYDAQKDRLCFPYWDVFGRLAGIRGRGIQFKDEWHPSPHYDYVWNKVNNASLVWFNEPLLDKPGPVVVVEGQFDAMRVARVYPRVMANLTAKPIMSKMAKLTQADGVILMMDGDDTGRAATAKFLNYLLTTGTPCQAILLPWDGITKTDPDKLGEAWIRESLETVGLLTKPPT